MEEIELMQDEKQKSRVKGQLPDVIFEEGKQNIIKEDDIYPSENDFVSKGGKEKDMQDFQEKKKIAIGDIKLNTINGLPNVLGRFFLFIRDFGFFCVICIVGTVFGRFGRTSS